MIAGAYVIAACDAYHMSSVERAAAQIASSSGCCASPAPYFDTVAFHGESAQSEIGLGIQDGGHSGIELVSPTTDVGEDLVPGHGGDVISADVV